MNIWNLANPITQGIILISMMLEIEECLFWLRIQSLLYLLPNPLSTPIPHNRIRLKWFMNPTGPRESIDTSNPYKS